MFNRNHEVLLRKGEGLLKRKKSTFAISALLGSILVCLTFVAVLGQSGTTISTINPVSGTSGAVVNVQGTIDTANGSYLLYIGSQPLQNSQNGIANVLTVNTNFVVPSLPAGSYNVTLQDAISNGTAMKPFTIVSPTGFAAIPLSTFTIMGVAIAVALLNSAVNRALVSHFIGWSQYKSMQKEMAEWRSQQMAAMRAND